MVNNQQMPGAWYDLGGRVNAASSVAACAMEALPNGLKGMEAARVDCACNLIAALQDLLMLIEQDVNLINETLKL